MNEYRPTFFIVKNRALGDSVMGLSSVSYLRTLYPNSTIIYAIPQWTTYLYQNISTDADIIYPLRINSLNDILNLYTDLIDLSVDYIHEMHQSGTGRKIFGFYSLIKNIPYSFHNHHLEYKTKIFDQGLKKELIQRDLDGIYSVLGHVDKFKKYPQFLDFEPQIKILGSIIKKNRIILGVVATRETKMWSLENYLNLAIKIIVDRPEFEVSIPLSQSKEDLEIKLYFENNNLDSRIKVVQLSLNELPKYFAESSLYVGNDTGLKHIAVATKIKTITLFGPEPIREWHPYDRERHIALFRENLSCRTRTHHYCGLFKCDLNAKEFMQCMQGITVENVLETINRQLWI